MSSKWADGHAYFQPYRGEKWDHLRFDDVDRDGDIDIIANAEEHHDGGLRGGKALYLHRGRLV